jgi:prephenate dehydratase
MRTLGYLGPPGTFSHTAALRYAGARGLIPVCYNNLEEIFRQVEAGGLEKGIVPAENSTGGPVGETHDLLMATDQAYIVDELLLPVRQHLMARPGVAPAEIKKVYSHPQALAQCRKFLQARLPGVPVVETASTAAAASAVAASVEPLAAIGSDSAAATYGLEILDAGIQSNNDNTTRFLVLGRDKKVFGGPAKTSLALAVKDRPGALYRILREFSLREINLTRIESRPAGGRLGDYIFFIDVEGREEDRAVAGALGEVQKHAIWLKRLGCYPAAKQARGNDAELPGRESLAGLRGKIDLVDAEIIQLLTLRQGLVDRVAAFKAGIKEVVDSRREKEIMFRVRESARENNLDPDLVAGIYRLILKGSVRRQQQLLAGYK